MAGRARAGNWPSGKLRAAPIGGRVHVDRLPRRSLISAVATPAAAAGAAIAGPGDDLPGGAVGALARADTGCLAEASHELDPPPLVGVTAMTLVAIVGYSFIYTFLYNRIRSGSRSCSMGASPRSTRPSSSFRATTRVGGTYAALADGDRLRAARRRGHARHLDSRTARVHRQPTRCDVDGRADVSHRSTSVRGHAMLQPLQPEAARFLLRACAGGGFAIGYAEGGARSGLMR